MDNEIRPLDSDLFQNPQEISRALSAYISRVYNWMTLALFITGIVAYFTASSPAMINFIFSSKLVFYGLLIGELLLVIYLSRVINTLSSGMATMLFILYSAMNGLTLSAIFLIYTSASISTTFYVAAGTFGLMSLYGYYTKKDLTSIGNMAYMALIGIILASVVNWFFQSEMLYWIVTYVGVLVFVGLVAYDTQKIKQIGMQGFADQESHEKSAIMGALHLYLDFINLFLLLLRVLGNRK